MLHELSEESKKAGLKMNIKKTKVMSRTVTSFTITVQRNRIDKVESYIHLGKKISLENIKLFG